MGWGGGGMRGPHLNGGGVGGQSLPFGGRRESGFGQFGGVEGLRGCCVAKAVAVDRWPGLIQTRIPKILQVRSGGLGGGDGDGVGGEKRVEGKAEWYDVNPDYERDNRFSNWWGCSVPGGTVRFPIPARACAVILRDDVAGPGRESRQHCENPFWTGAPKCVVSGTEGACYLHDDDRWLG